MEGLPNKRVSKRDERFAQARTEREGSGLSNRLVLSATDAIVQEAVRMHTTPSDLAFQSGQKKVLQILVLREVRGRTQLADR